MAKRAICGTGERAAVCLGRVDVPESARFAFEQAGTMAIDAVYSEEFSASVRAFVARHAGEGSHASAWAGVNVDQTLAALRDAIRGQSIETYGGLHGWFMHRLFGNMAYDGDAAGPIRVNRAGLPRAAASIANTIVHEVAHRIGLQHPHSQRDLRTARCEPPYVLGSLAEKQISASAWEKSADDCPLLD